MPVGINSNNFGNGGGSPFSKLMQVVNAYQEIKGGMAKEDAAKVAQVKDAADVYDKLGDKAPPEVKKVLGMAAQEVKDAGVTPANLSEVAQPQPQPGLSQVVNMTPKKKRELDHMAEQANIQAAIQGKAIKAIPNYNTGEIEFQDAPVSKKQAQKDAYEKEKTELEIAAKKKELAKKDNPTGANAQAATYAARMQDAEQVFGNLERNGYDPTTLVNAAAGSSWVPEAVRPENAKKMDQAKRSFINAVLRRESGAAIADSEFESANKQYFPAAGDTKEVLEQKALNRQRAFEGMRLEAGETFGKMSKAGASYPKGKGKQPPGGHMTVQQNGHTYTWNSQTGKYE